ncbi:MAG: hypothetical protein WCL60_06310 [Methylococcales bacterium]|jgi:carbon starvation protein CstA|nr:MAG: hypothetical protein D0528_12375 [Methylococcales bacterium]
MSELHEQKTEVVVLERIPSHQNLMKVNRWLTAMVVFLMAVIIIAGFFIVPSNKLKNSEVNNAEINPALSAEVNTLKGQFVGLVSGSIESKLRVLEESIRLGTVSNSLGTLEDLKNDVQVLKSYTEPVKKEVATVVPNEQLIQEMSHLKRLVYLTLASCGLMLAAIGGVWLRSRFRLPYKEVVIRYLGKKQ